MIICLSGFVIAGTSPTALPLSVRSDLASSRYSVSHVALLQQLSPARSSSSDSGSECAAGGAAVGGGGGVGLVGGGVGGGRWSRVRTLYACLGESEGELSFEPNQIVTNVSASGEPGWLRGTLNGRTGLVPENYVEPLP